MYVIGCNKSQEFLLNVRRLFYIFQQWRHCLHVDASYFLTTMQGIWLQQRVDVFIRRRCTLHQSMMALLCWISYFSMTMWHWANNWCKKTGLQRTLTMDLQHACQEDNDNNIFYFYLLNYLLDSNLITIMHWAVDCISNEEGKGKENAKI